MFDRLFCFGGVGRTIFTNIHQHQRFPKVLKKLDSRHGWIKRYYTVYIDCPWEAQTPPRVWRETCRSPRGLLIDVIRWSLRYAQRPGGRPQRCDVTHQGSDQSKRKLFFLLASFNRPLWTTTCLRSKCLDKYPVILFVSSFVYKSSECLFQTQPSKQTHYLFLIYI